jgi:hypothetical protein
VAGLKDAGSEDVLEAKRRVAEASAELDAARTCAAAALLFANLFAKLVANIWLSKMRPPAVHPAACGVMRIQKNATALVARRHGTWPVVSVEIPLGRNRYATRCAHRCTHVLA